MQYKIAIPLKYPNNFWRSLNMLLINCKIELKLKWVKYCVSARNGNDVICTIKDTKLYVPVVTLAAKDNQKLSKLLSKEFERSVYWNVYRTKSEDKNKTNEYRYFLESNFVRAKRLFVLVYSNQDDNGSQGYYLPKGIIKSHNVIISRKKIYLQPIDSDMKRYVEIRKVATRQSADCTIGCSLNYDYIKNHYRLIAIDLSKSKELDADPKGSQQVDFVGQLKYPNNGIVDNKSMFVSTILKKIQKRD